MKKASLVILLLLITCLTACSSPLFDFLPKSDQEIRESRYEEIIAALEANDNDALEALFSNAVKEDQETLKAGVNYAMNIFKGEIISSEHASITSSSTKGGQKVKEIQYKSTVETDLETYLVFFVEIVENDYDADEIGLYMLQIIPFEDKDGNFDWGTEIRCPGVYILHE